MAEIVDQQSVLDKIRQFRPLWRLLLATPGTLQGTLSAYFGAPITIEVVSQDIRGGRICRAVNLVCRSRDMVVCRAETEISVENEEIRRMIEDKDIGLGRIIAMLNVPANFELDEVGRQNGTFWRNYRLSGDGFEYAIREEFPMLLYADIHGEGA